MKRGDIVRDGPWAGWRVVRARIALLRIGMWRDGNVGAVLNQSDPPEFVCCLEDPSPDPWRPAPNIVLTDKQVRPGRPLGRVRV